MQKYGLQLRKKPAASSSRPPPPVRPLAAFADDGDDDVEADILRQSSKKRALQKVTNPLPSRYEQATNLVQYLESEAPNARPREPFYCATPAQAAPAGRRGAAPSSPCAARPRRCLPLPGCLVAHRFTPLLAAAAPHSHVDPLPPCQFLTLL